MDFQCRTSLSFGACLVSSNFSLCSLMREIIDRCVDISEIVVRHYLNILFICTNYKRLGTHIVCIDLFIVYDISII